MAVETSVAQMALTRDNGPGGFMERFAGMLAFVCKAVLAESISTPYHSGRALYAQRVVQNPIAAAQAGGPLIVMGVNIYTNTTYDEATKTSTCTATDLELQSQVQTDWNA